MKRKFTHLALLICVCSIPASLLAGDGLEFNSRHVHRYIKPSLPDIARRMNLKGTVKLEVAISPDGKVTAIKPLGGHPLLVDSATFAVKAWVFDSAAQPTTAIVTVAFE